MSLVCSFLRDILECDEKNLSPCLESEELILYQYYLLVGQLEDFHRDPRGKDLTLQDMEQCQEASAIISQVSDFNQ